LPSFISHRREMTDRVALTTAARTPTRATKSHRTSIMKGQLSALHDEPTSATLVAPRRCAEWLNHSI
jgi:hypothetical protein